MDKLLIDGVELYYNKTSWKAGLFVRSVVALLLGVGLFFLFPRGDDAGWWWLLFVPLAFLELVLLSLAVEAYRHVRTPNPFLRAHAGGIDFNLVTGRVHLDWGQVVDLRGAMTKEGPVISIFVRHPEQFAEQQGRPFLREFSQTFREHGTYFCFFPKQFLGDGIAFLAACGQGLEAAKQRAEAERE